MNNKDYAKLLLKEGESDKVERLYIAEKLIGEELTTIINDLAMKGIKVNQDSDVKVVVDAAYDKLGKYLDDDEVRDNYQIQAIVRQRISTPDHEVGIRITPILRLSVEDIDWGSIDNMWVDSGTISTGTITANQINVPPFIPNYGENIVTQINDDVVMERLETFTARRYDELDPALTLGHIHRGHRQGDVDGDLRGVRITERYGLGVLNTNGIAVARGIGNEE